MREVEEGPLVCAGVSSAEYQFSDVDSLNSYRSVDRSEPFPSDSPQNMSVTREGRETLREVEGGVKGEGERERKREGEGEGEGEKKGEGRGGEWEKGEGEYVFVCVNIGDCKAYRYRQADVSAILFFFPSFFRFSTHIFSSFSPSAVMDRHIRWQSLGHLRSLRPRGAAGSIPRSRKSGRS